MQNRQDLGKKSHYFTIISYKNMYIRANVSILVFTLLYKFGYYDTSINFFKTTNNEKFYPINAKIVLSFLKHKILSKALERIYLCLTKVWWR